MLFCFVISLFTSATLLFLVQPMIAKMILPSLGGAPAVWNTCMVFFQAALLAGYSYAHWLPTWLGIRKQAFVHIVVLALPFLVLPISTAGWIPPAETNPLPWLLTLLVVTVGAPFLVVAASAPLLQKWFASTGHPMAADPYFLYGASNLGSMVALLSYPLVIEPHLRLMNQSRLWAVGYGILVILMTACAAFTWRFATDKIAPGQSEKVGEPAPRWSRRLRWLALAFVPSSLMLGVTTYITTDVAAIPLLWVLPLALYLLSFILVFSRVPAWVHGFMVSLLPIAVLLLIFPRLLGINLGVSQMIGLHLGAFFVAAMVCHGELARTRPGPRHLTEFYLWMSLGGMLGGMFNGLVAPVVFHRIVEYPLIIVAACLLRPRLPGVRKKGDGLQNRPTKGDGLQNRPTKRFDRGELYGYLGWTMFGAWAGVLLFAMAFGGEQSLLLHIERNFFGVLSVRMDADPDQHFLYLEHGTTIHGVTSLDPALRREPLAYFHRGGPIGQVFTEFSGPKVKASVAVTGLGCGTLACYAEKGQEWTFFEIDPAVERLARNERFFTYLGDAEDRGVNLKVILGDARLQMEHGVGGYGLMVMDAFSSDAIPVHLLTREALQLYLRKLSPDGVLAFHISSQYLKLAPVLGDLAQDAGLVCYFQQDQLATIDYLKGKLASQWVILARTEADLGKLAEDPRWRRLGGRPGDVVWTDDYSNLISVVSWIRETDYGSRRGSPESSPGR